MSWDGASLIGVGGHTFPIRRMYPVQGGIKIEFAMIGPIEPFGPLRTRVLGPDGKLAWEGRLFELSKPIKAGAIWEISYKVSIVMSRDLPVQDLARAEGEDRSWA